MPIFLKRFYCNWVRNFAKGFFCIYWDDHMVFIFEFVNIVYHIDDLHTLKNSCIPRINPTWSWCMRFLMCCWILFAKFYWGFLHLCSSVILVCSFLFLWHLCQVLVLGWWWPHRMSLEVYDSTFPRNAIVRGFLSLRKEGTRSRRHFCILLLRLQGKKQ